MRRGKTAEMTVAIAPTATADQVATITTDTTDTTGRTRRKRTRQNLHRPAPWRRSLTRTVTAAPPTRTGTLTESQGGIRGGSYPTNTKTRGISRGRQRETERRKDGASNKFGETSALFSLTSKNCRWGRICTCLFLPGFIFFSIFCWSSPHSLV